jgi:hypothetical protein
MDNLSKAHQRKIKKLSTVEVIQTINDGGALEDLRTAIAEVSIAVVGRGGKGKVVLTLDFEKKKSSRGLTIIDTIKTAVPPIPKDPTTFFALESGELTRDNPEQPGFALSEEEEE